jgi:hypothetical protein
LEKDAEKNQQIIAKQPTWTIKSISQRVPLPLRKTSSGDIGIIVARENMNG